MSLVSATVFSQVDRRRRAEVHCCVDEHRPRWGRRARLFPAHGAVFPLGRVELFQSTQWVNNRVHRTYSSRSGTANNAVVQAKPALVGVAFVRLFLAPFEPRGLHR